jgi:hypothetical protein
MDEGLAGAGWGSGRKPMKAGDNSMNAQENIKRIFAPALEKESPAERESIWPKPNPRSNPQCGA